MRIDPALVVVGNRVRKNADAGIHALAKSIEDVGQLQPIVVDERDGQFHLIAGARRLRACQLLERDVDAVVAESVTDALKRLKAERDENTCRLDFTAEEAVEAGRAIEALEKPKAAERQKSGTGADGSGGRGNKKPTGKLPEGIESSGRARDAAAAAVGMSPRTYDKAKAVVEAAEKDPQLRPVVDEMNRTGKVDPAYRKVKSHVPPKREWNVLDDARKFKELRDRLHENWKTDGDRAVMRNTFRQLANEV